MMLRRFPLASTPTARTSAAVALLALFGIGIATANTEAVVAGRFTAALEAAPQKTASLSNDRVVSGTEAYWLAGKQRHENGGAALEPAAWSATPLATDLSVGSRITISTSKGERILQVVAITDVEPAPAAAHDAQARLIAVTCRDMSTPEGRLMTFTVPTDAVSNAKTARAL